MKNLKITLLTLCLLGSYAIQAQNPHWALYPLKKFTLSTNSMSVLPGTAVTCGTANTKGLFDASGNPVFYVLHNKIYNKTGGVAFTIPGPSYCVRGFHIVPVPGGSCGEYYVVYVKVTELGAFPNGGAPYDGYEIGAIRVTVDANQNITVSNSISKVTYADFPLVISTNIETALSKESNNERTLYATIRRSASPNFNTDQLVKVRLNNSGLTKNGSLMSTKDPANKIINTRTLELSPNQASLAWIQWTGGIGAHIAIMDVATGAMSSINLANIDDNSELEFGANSNDLYVTTSQGIVRTSLSNPQSSTFVTGTSSIHHTGNIELGLNGKLYATATNNILYTITGTSATPGNYYGSRILPEQVDGETIVYQAPSPLTIYLMMMVNGNTQATVTGGSGNYTYTWYDSFGGVVATGISVKLCRRGQHTLVVRDNASGCSTSYSFTNYPSFACRTTSAEITIGKVGVYPNPATDYLKIQANSKEQIVQLQVVNLKGQVMVQEEGNQTATQRLSVNGLKKGLYILNVVTDKSSSQTKFFVK
ncbi:T9SS type A sorting domain-containing protein [uncultured Microscilla sp.]|uniref:T9SS type A sorting domain-containing protein n=1 Tax=uncultured Microscilla sp. TaxID=432653 RepID=UPI00262D7E7F|nr:T9SS type A sorting domain-containing protein [uncultured Microscilla sp.]